METHSFTIEIVANSRKEAQSKLDLLMYVAGILRQIDPDGMVAIALKAWLSYEVIMSGCGEKTMQQPT